MAGLHGRSAIRKVVTVASDPRGHLFASQNLWSSQGISHDEQVLVEIGNQELSAESLDSGQRQLDGPQLS